MTYETMQDRTMNAEQPEQEMIPMSQEKRLKLIRNLEEMLKHSHKKRGHLLKMMAWILVATILAVILEVQLFDLAWVRSGIFVVASVAQVAAFSVLVMDSIEAAQWYMKLDAYAYPNEVPSRKLIERGEAQTFLEDDIADDENYSLSAN